MKKLKDSKWFYWNLSHREKFYRNLKILPFLVLAWIVIIFMDMPPLLKWGIILADIVLMLAILLSAYRKMRAEESEREKIEDTQ